MLQIQKIVVILPRKQTRNKPQIMSTTEINSNFRIKVNGINNEGRKINTLVGCDGAIKLIGKELFDKFVARAFNSTSDNTTCKLRRGLKITFYGK